jgi:spore germination protein YaaH
VVFYVDRKALAAKLDMLLREHPGVAGIAIWEAKDEDPRFWDVIVAELGGSAGGN